MGRRERLAQASIRSGRSTCPQPFHPLHPLHRLQSLHPLQRLYTRFMAVRRGVWLVLSLIAVAIVISTIGVIATSFFVAGGRPAVPSQTALVLGDGRARRDRGRRHHRSADRRPADRPGGRRDAARGEDRLARQPPDRPSDRRLAVLGQDAGDSRRHHRLPQVGQEDRRVPRIRRRSGVLPRHRVRARRARCRRARSI